MSEKQPERKDDKEKEREEIFEKLQKILNEYHGLESNIPLNHEYWGLLNNYRNFEVR